MVGSDVVEVVAAVEADVVAFVERPQQPSLRDVSCSYDL